MQALIDEVKKHLPRDRESRRIFHGRGRVFPGYQDLVIDAYGGLLFVTLFASRAPEWLAELAEVLLGQFPKVKCIAVQRRNLKLTPVEILYGVWPADPMAHEAGLNFYLRPLTGQNIGFFIDMAVGRNLVRKTCEGKRVLNLFAYSCSFSVAAIAGGAQQVVNVDMNRSALELGRRNHQLNAQDLRDVSFLPLEIFRSFSRLNKLGPFDLIICDPPFAQGKNFTAETHWPKLVSRLETLLTPGGEVFACLNAPQLSTEYLRNIFTRNLPRLTEKHCLYSGEDFPESDPERGLSLQYFVSETG
ncbi:class I SAM-dependent methyltransferase [Geopsychrobacter electrodiphilus]|uniref:class I SAM-dependent methyltransferase n=1 Tax=Geopsychrobacter electrodiphilus TaxID=225196 RepID=UPI0003674D53|nr:class I SAM-dependent methyltransferase [Geopsychrobacter electrodiphilus]